MAKYIECEAVMQKFADHVERSNNSDFAPVPTWNQAVQIVEDFPAADVRPVVRGEWIEHDEPYSTDGELIEAQYWYECSICGRWEYEKEPFCNCGAMMEESDGT